MNTTLTSNQETLGNNQEILKNFMIDLDKMKTINGLPFYSGAEFKLPENSTQADVMINEIGNNIDAVSDFNNSDSFKEGWTKTLILEKEETKNSHTLKKLMIRGLILIHWKFNYLLLKEKGQNINKPTRSHLINKIFNKLLKCSNPIWKLPSEYRQDTVNKVMISLLNGDELDIVMLNFPLKALHIYGW